MHKNNTATRLIAAAMIMAMALMALTGCSATINDPVVAEVGDVEVYYSNFYNTFSTYAQYGIIDTSNPETLADGRTMIMDMMIQSALPIAAARQQGLTLTEEELQEAREQAQVEMDSLLAGFEDSSIEDETARREAAIKAFDKAYKSNGYSYAKIMEEVQAQYEDNALALKLQEQVFAEVEAPSDEEIQARYDEELAADKENYAENSSDYYSDSMYYSMYGNLRPLVAPDGLYYVKHILIMNEENASEENKGRDHLALAEEVLAKVEAGEDFDALIEQYNEDPGMASNPDGYVIGADFEGVYDPPFQAAAAELKNEGDHSGIVEGASGYHIILRAADVSTDPVPFEDVKEEIAGIITSERENELYSSKLEEWKEQIEIVTYDKRVQYVGVSN